MSDSKTARRMVSQHRNVLLWLLFSVFTLGIYNLWFISRWADDVNLMCNGDDDRTPGIGQFLLCDILTFGIYKYVWLSRLADRLAENAPRFGVDGCADGEAVFICFILCLPLFGIGPFLALEFVMSDSNRVAKAYNAGVYAPRSYPARAAKISRSSEAEGGLLGMAGTYRGCRVPLRSGERVVIGRSTDADIVVKGTKISRHHCIISYNAEAQEYNVLDVSQNGVLADGKRLTSGRQYTMRSGTMLKLADGSEQFKLL